MICEINLRDLREMIQRIPTFGDRTVFIGK